MAFYDYTDIDKTRANYRIIIGQRSNGKTYGYKKKMVDNFVENGKESAYVRTLAENIKSGAMNLFFDDIFDYLTARLHERYPEYSKFGYTAKNDRWTIYALSERDDTGAVDKINLGVIGYYFALTQGNKYKSTPYPNISLMAWDEFTTRGFEPPETFSLFINLVSTIKRQRDDFTVYLLGNTVTRNSAVLENMHINIRDLRQGDIKLYEYTDIGTSGETIRNTVAVEYCETMEQAGASESYFVFNSQREMMIRHGEWETNDYPTFDVNFDDITVKLAARVYSGAMTVYVYLTADRTLYVSSKRLYPANDPDYLSFTNSTIINRRQFAIQSDLPPARRFREIVRSSVINDRVRYDNNLTGDDFTSFLQNNHII